MSLGKKGRTVSPSCRQPAGAGAHRRTWRSAAIVLAAVISFPAAAGAVSVENAVVLGRGVAPTVAANEAGAAVAVWQRPHSGLLIAAVRSRRGTWSTGQIIGRTGAAQRRWRHSTVDVAIDPSGNSVVVWTRRRRGWPERVHIVAVTYRRPDGWSSPHLLTRVRSPHNDMSTGPGGHPRPSVGLDATGGGVAAWARLTPVDPVAFGPGDTRFVIEAVILGADGAWSTPRTLGETYSPPSLAVGAAGDAVVAWHTGTLSPDDYWLTRELMVARKSADGTWSQPEVIMSHAFDPTQSGSPAAMSHVRVVLEPLSEHVTASWTEAKLGPGDEGYRLRVATLVPGVSWPAPHTLDARMDTRGPVFLGADRRGEVDAVWLTEPHVDRNDQALRAAAREADGRWSAPATIARATAGIPYHHMSLLHAVTTPSGQLVVLVSRNDQSPTQPSRSRSTIQAYTRTPDHVWSGPHMLASAPRNSQFRLSTGHLAPAEKGRALAIWSSDSGRVHRVRIAAVIP